MRPGRFMEGMNPLPDVVAASTAKAPAGGRRYEVQIARRGCDTQSDVARVKLRKRS
jgi:hypothetical protein